MIICLLISGCALHEYKIIDGIRIYEIDYRQLNQTCESEKLVLKSKLDKIVHKFGEDISIFLEIVNISDDSINMLPYSVIYLEDADQSYTNSVTFSLHSGVDLTSIKTLSPHDTCELRFLLSNYVETLNKEHEYNFFAVYQSSIYRMNGKFLFAGRLKSDTIRIKFNRD